MACNLTLRLAKFLLVIINVVFMIVGAVLTGFSGYALSQGPQLTAVLPKSALVVAAASGAGLMLFSCIGCTAATKHKRFLLFVYSAVVLAIILSELIAGVLIGSYLGLVSGIDIHNPAADQAQKEFVVALNSTYNFCCVNNPDAPACSWINDVAPGCAKGVGLSGGLGEFKDDVQSYIQTNMKPFSTVLIILAIVELVSLFSACHLACMKPERKIKYAGLPYDARQPMAAGQPVYS